MAYSRVRVRVSDTRIVHIVHNDLQSYKRISGKHPSADLTTYSTTLVVATRANPPSYKEKDDDNKMALTGSVTRSTEGLLLPVVNLQPTKRSKFRLQASSKQRLVMTHTTFEVDRSAATSHYLIDG